MAFPALLCLPHYLINGTIFENIIEHEMCVLTSLRSLCETFFILRRNERDMIKMFIVLHASARYSSPILINLELSRQIL